MNAPDFLIEGYKAFRAGEAAKKLKGLSDGQAPKVMAIGCSDSRVHPATIFSADPGDIFMVRNVANIVPPYDPGEGYHGTSAALEFAVKSLKVKYILVLGHSGCGGVAASLASAENQPVGDFIGPWVSIMDKAREEVLAGHDHDHQTRLEKANVRGSLDNLRTFPFIKDAVNQGTLTLLGAWFNIETAELEWVG